MKFFAIEFATYRQLQAKAKQLGIKANGTKAALRNRITRYRRDGLFGLIVRAQRPQYYRWIGRLARKAFVASAPVVKAGAHEAGFVAYQAWQLRGTAWLTLVKLFWQAIAFAISFLTFAVTLFERIETEHSAPYQLPAVTAAHFTEFYVEPVTAPLVEAATEALQAAEPAATGETLPALAISVAKIRLRRQVTCTVNAITAELKAAPVAAWFALNLLVKEVRVSAPTYEVA